MLDRIPPDAFMQDADFIDAVHEGDITIGTAWAVPILKPHAMSLVS
jgi:hypothetical protein